MQSISPRAAAVHNTLASRSLAQWEEAVQASPWHLLLLFSLLLLINPRDRAWLVVHHQVCALEIPQEESFKYLKEDHPT